MDLMIYDEEQCGNCGFRAILMAAIYEHCLECVFGDRGGPEACSDESCNLHPFRYGRKTVLRMPPEEEAPDNDLP